MSSSSRRIAVLILIFGLLCQFIIFLDFCAGAFTPSVPFALVASFLLGALDSANNILVCIT